MWWPHLNRGTVFTMPFFLHSWLIDSFKDLLNYIVPSVYNNITMESKKMAGTTQAEA